MYLVHLLGFLFVLRFYGPVDPVESCRAQSVYLTTCYWAGLVLQAINQYCAHSFARSWQLPLLNQQKGENDHRKYFMINLHERMLLTSVEVEPVTSWSQVGRASNWAMEAIIHLLGYLFMPPTSKKLEGHIASGLFVRPSVCPFVTFFDA